MLTVVIHGCLSRDACYDESLPQRLAYVPNFRDYRIRHRAIPEIDQFISAKSLYTRLQKNARP
ncbi:hypothetical protein CY34DRAFT_807506 [Suillus luteus UH-Slu-Lm8-n1]|uniref:Uncharacterized protein n=1 Tax=Suillus luteus UH-Slu-Lm8-n1 TaxID=930992 RepID=A0A0D0AQ34_9AGAM|nr:hypothetical protein CY34DRAFT_807506 [Suillus luteus UH-Slu-Lm8-n1]